MEIWSWMEAFLAVMRRTFGDWLVFVGLQGSRGRGEGTAESDIDVVVILDRLAVKDLDAFRAAAEKLPERKKLCGFVSGVEELSSWDAAELFQFYYDTTACLGSLDFLLPRIGEPEIRRAVHLGACNLYHACCYNYLHEREPEILKDCYKSAFFVLQAKHFLETGEYVSGKDDLLPRLTGRDRQVMSALLAGTFEDFFVEKSALLLEWASERIVTIKV